MPRKKRTVPWLTEDPETGVFYAHWYDAEQRRTKRQSLHTSDPSQAQASFAAFLTAPDLREPARLVGLTVAQVLNDYLREHVAEKVIDKGRQEDAAHHLVAFFNDTPIREIDIPASRRYRDARRKGDVGGGTRRHNRVGSDSTIRRELVVLNAAAKHAVKWRRIQVNDLPSIELPSETRNEAPYLTVEQVNLAIASAASPRLRRFIKLLYYTAARRKSVERLTRFQVDLRLGRINLRGPDEDELRRRSKKRRPVVPLHPEIRPDVEQLLTENAGSEFLFGDTRDMYRPFVECLTALGFDATNPHILRHSRATHLLQQGVPIYDVARLLGDTVATVDRVYGHHCPEYMAATMGEKTA